MNRWISLLLCLCVLVCALPALAEEGSTPTPTEAPAVAPTEAPTAAPDETLEKEPTDAPAVSPEATDAPETEEAPSEAPTEEATPAPEATDAAETSEPTPPSAIEAEAWTKLEGEKVAGTLKEIIEKAAPDARIYIATEKVVKLPDAVLKKLARLVFLPDPEAFEKVEAKVFVYAENPEKVEKPDEIDLTRCEEAEGEMDLFFRVERVDSEEQTPAPTETPTPTEAPVPVIDVVAQNYNPARWSSAVPTFRLGGIGEAEGYSYAVIRFGTRIEALDDDEYDAEDDGVYTLRFVIEDEMGDIVSASDVYTLLLDYTAPTLTVTVDEATGLTLDIESSDSQSGVRALSLDGGSSWISMGDEEEASYSCTYATATTIEAGQIIVMDAAGNAFASVEDIVLKPVSNSGGGGGGGGSGGGSDGDGSGKKPVSHGSGSGVDEGVYDQVDVEAAGGAAHQLVLGGETLALTLDLTEAQDFEIPWDYQAKFTTEVKSWPVEGMAVRRDDTVVLKALRQEGLGERYVYRWQFNGEVIKLLGNSGIRYLVLQVDDQVLTLPTEGFTGGTKYTELKMSGVSTRKFDYVADMTNEGGAWSVRLFVTVEGEEYLLNQDESGEMYAYDVYTGDAALMEQPYGQSER